MLRLTHLLGARLSWTTPDPALGYRFQPNTAYWTQQENDHPVTGRINRFGWRDRDWALAQAPGTFRIAVLGDSFVEAMQVERDSTFLTLVERELTAEIGRPVEMMNFGRSGYTQSEELLVLQREVLPFAPDMVLVMFFPGNDIADINQTTAAIVQRPFFVESGQGMALDTGFVATPTYRFRTRIDALKRHSALVSLVIEQYMARQREQNAAAGHGLDEYLSLCTRHPSPTYLRNYSLNKTLLLEMARLLSSRAIAMGLVVIPTPAYMPAMERRFTGLDATFDPSWFEGDLRGFADSNGFAFLGLHDAFVQRFLVDSAPLNWDNIGHWTYAGHRVVADAIEEWLGPVIGPCPSPACEAP